MTTFGPYDSMIHWFSSFFLPKTGGRLKIVLPSFSVRVARGKLHLWLFTYDYSIKFIPRQFSGVKVRWLHRLRICFFSFVLMYQQAEFTSWILHECKSLSFKLRSKWDHIPVISSMIQFTLHLVQILDFAIGKSLPRHNRGPCMLYGCCDMGGCKFFYQFFVQHRLSYLTQGFRTLIFQSKGPYYTALLSSLCAPLPTGAF